MVGEWERPLAAVYLGIETTTQHPTLDKVLPLYPVSPIDTSTPGKSRTLITMTTMNLWTSRSNIDLQDIHIYYL